MKKTVLILLAALLFCTIALAEDGPAMTQELNMIQIANAALMERYGLTLPALGLFATHADICGETAIVTYTGSAIPEALTGTYYVIIAPHGVQPLWTFDGSLVPWQSGELESPVWGMPQLQKYLDTSAYERYDIFVPHFPDDLSTLAAFEAAGGSYHEVTSSNRGAANSARLLAIRAVTAMYDLSEEEAAKLVSWNGDTRLVRYPDRHGEWEVTVYMEGGTEELIFYVTIHAETGMILNIVVSSGGIG